PRTHLLLRVAGLGRGEVLGRAHRARHSLLEALGRIQLVHERLDRVGDVLAGGLYLMPDLADVFTHSMSSFTESTVSTGTGGVARRKRFTPTSTSTPASAASAMATISAASQAVIVVASAKMAAAVIAPSAARPSTAAPTTSPPPMAVTRAFSAISTLASSASFLSSWEIASLTRLVKSPSDWSASPLCVPVATRNPPFDPAGLSPFAAFPDTRKQAARNPFFWGRAPAIQRVGPVTDSRSWFACCWPVSLAVCVAVSATSSATCLAWS